MFINLTETLEIINDTFCCFLQGIESLKKEEARWVRKSRWKSIQAVFGRFSYEWFSPFADAKPPSKTHGYLLSV